VFRELDTVVLTHDIDEYGLKQGDVGDDSAGVLIDPTKSMVTRRHYEAHSSSSK